MHVKATSLASYLPLESHTTAPSSSGSRQKRTSGLSLFEAQRSWHQPVGVSQARAEHDTFRRGPLSSIDNTRANREAFSVNQVAELALQDYYHGKQDKLRADQATVVHEQQHEITCGPRINSTSHPRPIHTFSEEVIYPNMLDTRCGLVPRYSAPVGLEYSLRLPMAPFSYDAPRDSDTFAPKEKMLVSATLRVPHPTWDDSLRFQNKEHFMKPPPPPLPRRPKETYQYYHDSSSVPSEALKEPEMPIYELCAQDAEISEPLTMKQFGRISHQLPTASQFLCPKQNMMSTDSNVAKEAIGMDTLGTPKLAKLDTQKDRDDCYDRRNHKIPELDTSLSSKELRESQFVENLGQTSTRIDDSSKSRTSSYPKKANKGLEFDNFYTPANERFYNARPYTALNRNLKEIRLLRVFPKKPLGQHYKAHPKWVRNNAGELDRSKAVIACEIEKTSLTRIGDNFITLSYCAGDPRKTTLVLADGLPFNAFANLEHAMEKLAVHWALTHADGEPLLLWADQISINQSDKDERSNQVQIMRDIYRRSAQTYVCLSDPQVENCLSWTKKSGIIANTTKDPKGTLELQALLCNTLIGEENARHILPISPDPTLDKPCTDREEDLISQTLRTREDTQGIVGRHSFPVRFSELHRDRSFKRSPTLTRSLTRAQTIARHDADEVSLSPADFQSSLVAFITSRWWRRYVKTENGRGHSY